MTRITRPDPGPSWVLARLAPGMYAAATGVSATLRAGYPDSLSYHVGALPLVPAPPDLSFTLHGARWTSVRPGDPAGAGPDLLITALRKSGIPELAALADLAGAHREEYAGLIDTERVLRALA